MTTSASAIRRYSPWSGSLSGSTGTGLDQLISWLGRDPGLRGSTDAPSLAAGIAAADALNQLIATGLASIGRSSALVLTPADLIALNAWIRSDPTRLQAFIHAHGDDEGAAETGFHRLVNNGASQLFHGNNLVNTILDSVYHFGFQIDAAGNFLNEDGDANASLQVVAKRLSALRVEVATTNTELDRTTEAILADAGLANQNPLAQIKGGAEAANGINQLILAGLASLSAGTGSDPNRIEVSEVLAVNAWIRQDQSRYNNFVIHHGDDENGEETGFHLVQNDGANTTQFGLNLVNTVLDGIYHIGFEVGADGRFRNEDGNANARVTDVADWLNYYLGDPSTTGSGLDRIVDTARWDAGLATNTSAAQIRGGLDAANGLNGLILNAVNATGVNLDGWISRGDLRQLSQWIQTNSYDSFLVLHGDDEGGVETGFHQIQGDGGNVQALGKDLINTIADGIYHIGFAIEGDNFLNEDGNRNAALGDVSSWLNFYLNDRIQIIGTGANDLLVGTELAEQLVARDGNDLLEGGGGDDLLDGSWGDDTLLGGSGNDQLDGSYGNDSLNGGEGGDTYLVSGNEAGGWSSFAGFDRYNDTGLNGVDRILAVGSGNVDLGLIGFSASNGIERIEAAAGVGTVRLLGGWNGDILDFSQIALVGGSFTIDGYYGNDTITGSSAADTISGGGNDDLLNGGEGGDTYLVGGNEAGGWSSFAGFDRYNDTGLNGVDRILAVGSGNVDLGLIGFSASNGIERIEAAAGVGTVRLLGGWNGDILDFSQIALVGGSFTIDGYYGNDTITGSSAADTISGGGNDDLLNGGEGGDTYLVSGNEAGGWSSFAGFDRYNDTGLNGVDRILAVGSGNVDLGLIGFSASNGIERIEAAAGVGTVRLLGGWNGDILDFSQIALVGGSFTIDGYYGNDTITGSSAADTISGGGNDDLLNGGEGGDTYLVGGNEAGGWSSFAGFDRYNDTGLNGVDRILAVGSGNVDLGLIGFSASNGIERIEAAAGVGTVRLLGGWNGDILDFSQIALVGGAFTIDGYYGNDTITGSSAADTISGGGNDDLLNGGEGGDTYLVSGNEAGGWSSFAGFDRYNDTGLNGVDRILAVGSGNVDLGLIGFSASNGIERIEAAAGVGTVRLLGGWNGDILDFSQIALVGGSFTIDGYYGNDTITGSSAADTISGGGNDDLLNGGEGGDTYLVSGNEAGGWSSFAGFDRYNDTGLNGVDRILAVGSGNVDLGLIGFSASNGIERIEAAAGVGTVRLLGGWNGDILDFSQIALVGGSFTIDGYYGNDTITGSSAADTISGGGNDDLLNGGEGGDTYLVSGNEAGGWSSFAGFDRYNDTGLNGVDRILAVGSGNVDLGLIGFSASNGIERIEAAAGVGTVRLLGGWNGDILDFSQIALVGGAFTIDGYYGNDTITGSSAADTISGGGNDDLLNGGEGGDTYLVGGNEAGGWSSFAGFDRYNDTGLNGVDRILAVGSGNVDLGLIGFSASNGIERIEAAAGVGTVRLLGGWNGDILDFSQIALVGGSFTIDGYYGNDTITGSSAADTISGGGNDDLLNGGEGGDTYLVSGNEAGGWSSFAGFDRYNDTGLNGVDRILAVGSGNVDLGLIGFSASNGIERIEAAAGVGTVRLLGGWNGDILDFSQIALVGGSFTIDGYYGNDTITGSSAADTISGGGNDDLLNGGEGGDTYLVSGDEAGGWSSFAGFDRYNDTGLNGVDRILAVGSGNVDLGLIGFSASNGIERIEAAAGVGTVRLLGGWNGDILDFSQIALVGGSFTIDGYYGNDTITGSSAADTISGGGNDDLLNGGEGGDTYLVSGNEAGGWSSFAGFDRYNDTGLNGVDRILAVGSGNVDLGLIGFSASNGIERIEAAAGVGTVRLLGGWNGDILDFSQIALVGGAFTIDGYYGNDTITGSSAADTISGGGNDDRLIGGLGADQLTGGSGCDVFAFNSVAEMGIVSGSFDIITDFASQIDKIDLVGIDANLNITGDQAFRYIGSATFSGEAGQLRLANQILSGDVNGDGLEDFRLGLTGVSALLSPTDLRL